MSTSIVRKVRAVQVAVLLVLLMFPLLLGQPVRVSADDDPTPTPTSTPTPTPEDPNGPIGCSGGGC